MVLIDFEWSARTAEKLEPFEPLLKAPIAISVTQKGDFYINKTKVSAQALESELLKIVGVDKKKSIVIRGAKKVAYEKVVKIIDIAQRNKLKMVLAVKVSGK